MTEVDARVPYRSAISPSATDGQILEELYNLMTMQTRVFIVHMRTDLSSKLFAKAREIGMMTKAIHQFHARCFGIQTYVPQTVKLEEFMPWWKQQFQQDNPTIIDASIDVFGLWAYDSAFALAITIEEVGTATFGFQKTNASFNSAVLESPEFCQALSTTRFEGIAGDFSLVDGQLQSSNFEIFNINVVEQEKLDFGHHRMDGRKLGLGPIIWPGDSLSVPKGWENPTNGKKLRVGVPVKDGFTELDKVMKDPSTNMTYVTGFGIDVFKAAVEMLPYALPYEFIPFAKSDRTSGGTYNDLVYQIYLRHRINEDFRGTPSHQVGTSVWFSFSTMQLQPTVSDIKDVLRNGDNVGFTENTYINELWKQLGFDDSKIKMFPSFEECDELLSKVSANVVLLMKPPA
ncbi:glutamate receptor 2.8 [Prunus dulcis]|uniref:Glutamate receptor 2.8 n=1 Tax=Prunus dulcis TaxID=3755 RepID=A0A4Y1QXQ5_PRUDU|nr:glutamate receptor 2.8 [Prunus dulcis]